jgi:hypothetical protein
MLGAHVQQIAATPESGRQLPCESLYMCNFLCVYVVFVFAYRAGKK